jgi:chromosome segregation ATPase
MTDIEVPLGERPSITLPAALQAIDQVESEAAKAVHELGIALELKRLELGVVAEQRDEWKARYDELVEELSDLDEILCALRGRIQER